MAARAVINRRLQACAPCTRAAE